MFASGSPLRSLARTAALLSLSAFTAADTVTVALNGSYIERVTAGGVTLRAHQLRAGTSAGPVDFETSSGYAATAADGRNLEFYFARNSVSGDWIVDLGTWSNTNGSQHDFFMFETGGNDSVQVAPRFANGSLGQFTSISGWTSTGYNVNAGPNANQTVYGLAFRSSDLRDGNGNFLSQSQQLSGIAIRSNTIDGAAFLATGGSGTSLDGNGSVSVHGTMRKWHPVELRFRGPYSTESAMNPNPFLDYRLNVTFEGPQGQSYTVPGFFAGDGEGGEAGTIWKARIAPDGQGTWTATASFRQGTNVAVSSSQTAGSAGMLNGVTTSFTVGSTNLAAPGFLKWGLLKYVNNHYQRFKEGPFFIKTGTNSPENFLAYRGFDTVSDAGGLGILHSYPSHVSDWNPGDPDFRSDVHDESGKAIIGVLNYLSEQGVNSVFMMLMNLGGDGWDVHPFVGSQKNAFNKTHFDLGRMHQWNIVFEHAARKGIALHFGLAETESQNENWLDNGTLGTERKLFLREMIARFSHHPAVKWTLSEENDYSISNLRAFADYINDLDVYGHPVTFHNHPNDFTDYNQVYGDSRFCATSLQYNPDLAGSQVETLRAQSSAAGHPMVVQMDENNPWQEGLTSNNETDLRKRALYDVLFSGGQVEWYFGWHNLPLGGDLTLEDFRTREDMWETMAIARAFMETHLPFWEMQPMDGLISNASGNWGGPEAFGKAGEVYAVYLPYAAFAATIDLTAAPGDYEVRWFNPRSGSFEGGISMVQGGGSINLGLPPTSSTEDWVVLLKGDPNFTSNVTQFSASSGSNATFEFTPGPTHAGREYIMLASSTGTNSGFGLGSVWVPLTFDRYTRFTINHANGGILQNTSGFLDSNGAATMHVVFPPVALTPLIGSRFYHSCLLLNPEDYVSGVVEIDVVP